MKRNFDNRKVFFESKTWAGGTGTGDELTLLGPSLGRCKREVPAETVGKQSNRITGAVVRCHGNFAFLRPEAGGADVFVHNTELRRCGIARLTYGERLSFVIETGADGKRFARDIQETNN
jgi:cold shock protein